MKVNLKTHRRISSEHLWYGVIAMLLALSFAVSIAFDGNNAMAQPKRKPTGISRPQVKRQPGKPLLRDYEFETVTVNSKGAVIGRRKAHGKYYIEVINGVRFEMVRIPGGSFTMGSPEEESNGPMHRVRVPSFYMGKYEVTQAQWRAVAKLPKVNILLSTDPSHFKYDKLPVEQVSAEEAIEFCARLSRASGRTYRLPSEAEWEYACRAGTSTEFAFGETITPELANYQGSEPYGSAPQGWNRKQTTPVGSLGVANGFGLYDMHGNVSEWSLDLYHYDYKDAPTDGSVWEAGGNSSLRMYRGGAWDSRGYNCRCADRQSWSGGRNNVGFRVVAVSGTRSLRPESEAKSAAPGTEPTVAGRASATGPGGLPLLSYDFDTVTVDSNGAITDRPRRQARYYVEQTKGVRLEMVEIPGGSFTMGSPQDDSEKPMHQVKVPSFYIGKYEVTQAQWRAVAKLPKVSRDLKPNPSHFKGVNLPVDSVSWEDAIEFCARLSRVSGRTYRLPTEAEWEYACRGGTTTAFAFGENITPWLVNYDGRFSFGSAPQGVFRGRTTPVGFLEVANRFGVYDMDGNLRELCMDSWHESYEGAPTDGSAWDAEGKKDSRVVRGGSWDLPAHMCRVAHREWCPPDSCRLNVFGFRVVLALRTR